MTYPKAIVIAAALLSAAIVWASQPAQTASGAYSIVGAGTDAWTINGNTGRVSYCWSSGTSGHCMTAELKP